MDLEILKIASDTKNHKVLKDSSHFAKFKNPLCGDEMNVSLMVKGEKITYEDSGLSKREWNELMSSFEFKEKIV